MGNYLSYQTSENKEQILNMNTNVKGNKYKYTWKPDLPDQRDIMLVHPKLKKKDKSLPTKIDLRDEFGKVYDQGQLGSCTAQAICGTLVFNEKQDNKTNIEYFMPSRMFLYYNERNMEGNPTKDSGASLRDGLKSIKTIGICSEDDWVYDTSVFNIKPNEKCYKDALEHTNIIYKRIPQFIDQLQQTLVKGLPIICGISVYESFESDTVAKTGMIPMPTLNEKLLGGHAIVIVGYDDEEKYWICRNSWGETWGDKGYFYLPYDYMVRKNGLASDFWIINKF